MVFNVVNLEPETLQTDEVLERLPDDAADRHARHHPEDNDHRSPRIRLIVRDRCVDEDRRK